MHFLRLLSFVMIAVLTTASLTYVERTNPEMIEKLMLKFDVFGLTEAASKEQQRIAQIRALPIPYEQKKVLLERTIFIGATSQMVMLALGEPEYAARAKNNAPEKGRIMQNWIYYLNNEQLPTILEFENDVLISAKKGSKLDYATNQY